jgi:hypothetical protein
VSRNPQLHRSSFHDSRTEAFDGVTIHINTRTD